MTTILKIGPTDHGRPIAYDDFKTAAGEEGYRYELIDGKLYVTTTPDPPQVILDLWVFLKLHQYAVKNSELVNFVTNKSRIFVSGRRGSTNPEPDVAAFRDFPLHLPFTEIHWQEQCPIIVVEVVSADDPNKDLVRNVELYLQVPTIREYWIIDPRQDADHPMMLVYRRRGRSWQRVIEIGYGETYTTKLLPGFKLVLDPRK